jgi:hypothetical protein
LPFVGHRKGFGGVCDCENSTRFTGENAFGSSFSWSWNVGGEPKRFDASSSTGLIAGDSCLTFLPNAGVSAVWTRSATAGVRGGELHAGRSAGDNFEGDCVERGDCFSD